MLANIRLQGINPHLHLDRHVDAILGILHIALRFRITEEYHDGITNELIDRAAKFFSDCAHLGKVETQKLANLLSLDLLGDRGEVHNIGEKDGELLTLAFFVDIQGSTEDLLIYLNRQIAG